MEYVSGEIFTVNGFKRGYLGVENHRIMDRGKDSPPKKPMHKGLIVPTFVNAHTHIGDSFIRKRNLKLPRNVEDLVAPPDGLKHRLLKETSDQEIVDGMRESMIPMIRL